MRPLGRSYADQAVRKTCFFTVGHSTRTIAEFAELLRSAEIELVVDVRSIRRSRRNPQFNEEVLAASLEPFQIRYLAIPQLGGRRSKQKAVDQDLNAFWNNRSFHNYADYTLSDTFIEGLELLISVGTIRRCAMMCSEAVWWRCHRRIIADYLLKRNIKVFHLMDVGKTVPAALTQGAKLHRGGAITYPGGAENLPCC
ncbi:DNA repair protein [Rhizobium sp. Root149]|uniref:DUF488 domain-containing protein n=1 Tax=Rhizobium sp. Root149 TaxID=1736473 RepID=UPI0007127EF5|nr:DUF488 domain-containing protein [Rhizobium sp. Root149]KQZ46605.1 DNA repair protein [Rhizobium sp. Root149]